MEYDQDFHDLGHVKKTSSMSPPSCLPKNIGYHLSDLVPDHIPKCDQIAKTSLDRISRFHAPCNISRRIEWNIKKNAENISNV